MESIWLREKNFRKPLVSGTFRTSVDAAVGRGVIPATIAVFQQRGQGTWWVNTMRALYRAGALQNSQLPVDADEGQ